MVHWLVSGRTILHKVLVLVHATQKQKKIHTCDGHYYVIPVSGADPAI